MASLLAHAAVPLMLGGDPRARVLGVLCACAPDLDMLAQLAGIAPDALLAPRGLFHSIVFAAAIAYAAGRLGKRPFVPLFVAAASHGLIDTLNRGDVGVALAAPLAHRFSSPWQILPVSPVGIDEWFSNWGALTLLNEALLLVAPLALLALCLRLGLTRARVLAAAGWSVLTVALATLAPTTLAPFPDIPMSRAQTQTPWADLEGFLGRDLEPERQPWSSTFWPAWLGGSAGRWHDSWLTLAFRTLFKSAEPSAQGQLSPTEKVDLAMGFSDFRTTRFELQTTHNSDPTPRFWYGMCNGVSAFASSHAEPFRDVEVISSSGVHVRFHPNDIKALAASAFYYPAEKVQVDGQRETGSFDLRHTRPLRPAELIPLLVDRLGRQRKGLLIDVHATEQHQFYPVASARMTAGTPTGSVVPFAVDFTVAATTLPISSGAQSGKRVGLVTFHFSWAGELELDAQKRIVASRWLRGGPGSVRLVGDAPALEEGALLSNPHLSWPLVRELARRSAAEESAPINLSEALEWRGTPPE